jgi:hypothetical protein
MQRVGRTVAEKAIATLAGSVQGVVVQMTAESGSGREAPLGVHSCAV